MKEFEKLIAFTLLLVTIIVLAFLARGEQTFVMVDGKPVTVNSAAVLGGLISALSAVLGMAGQALFRTSETAHAMNELLHSTVDRLGKSAPVIPQQPGSTTTTTTTAADAPTGTPDAPMPVVIQQPAGEPVPVTTANEPDVLELTDPLPDEPKPGAR